MWRKSSNFAAIFMSKEYAENNVIVQEVDARYLERELVRTAELIDRHQAFVVLLTHYDDLLATEHRLDYLRLSNLIGVRVGLLEDKEQTIAHVNDFRHIHVTYGKDIEEAIAKVIDVIVTLPSVREKYSKRYMAIRLLERPDEMLALLPHSDELIRVAAEQRARLLYRYGKTAKEVIAQARRGFVHGALEETLTHAQHDTGHSVADKIDRVLTNRWIGLPLLMLLLYGVFECTFTLGSYPQEWIAMGVEALAEWIRTLLPQVWWSSLLIDGVLMGIGAVLAFLPNIIIMFFFLSLMEDSGYMARAAFIMDRLMHKIGLHGKSFIPFLIGFGCSVPAIMATRTLENRKDRIVTVLVTPFMSCSARLPVYLLFVAAFFHKNQGLILLSVYLVGAIIAILTALLLNKTAFRGLSEQFVMELPPYRIPTMRNTLIHMWDKSVQYLQKMATVILVASIIIWALEYFPRTSEESEKIAQEIELIENNDDISAAEKVSIIHSLELQQDAMHSENSYMGRLGHFIEPVVRPCGFDWRLGVSLATGIAAKEVVVSTLGVLLQADDIEDNTSSLVAKVKTQKWTSGPKKGEFLFTPLVAYGFMLFVLISTPCFATITAVRREAGWGAVLFTLLYNYDCISLMCKQI